MRKINYRRLSSTALAVAATAALTLGSTSTEAWGGKTSSWDKSVVGSNSARTSSWDLTGSNAGKTSSWDLTGSSNAGKTSSWDRTASSNAGKPAHGTRPRPGTNISLGVTTATSLNL